MEKRSLELDAPASRPSMYMKENRLPKKLKVPGTAAGHTTIAHTPGPEGLVGRAGGGGQLHSGASGGAGVHGQVCVQLLFGCRLMLGPGVQSRSDRSEQFSDCPGSKSSHRCHSVGAWEAEFQPEGELRGDQPGGGQHRVLHWEGARHCCKFSSCCNLH